jgi:hypothetical protein
MSGDFDYDDREEYERPVLKLPRPYGLLNASGIPRCWNCEGRGCEDCDSTGHAPVRDAA